MNNFEEIKNLCPWHGQDRFGYPICRASGEECAEENCAIVFWIKKDDETRS